MTTAPFIVATGNARRGPVRRSWHLDDPGAALGEIPGHPSSLDIDLEVSAAPDRGFRVRGWLRGTSRSVCRRCLSDVKTAISCEIDVWFRPSHQVTPGEEGVWPFDPRQSEIDVTDALREELWIATPTYVVCRDDCAGLCARCGVRLGEEACTCGPASPDPRWAELAKLRHPPTSP